jgi:cbb3-type cytochrome oxidase subunit 3
MKPARRRIYSWAVFLVLLIVFLAIVWVILHTEPAAGPDYQGALLILVQQMCLF